MNNIGNEVRHPVRAQTRARDHNLMLDVSLAFPNDVLNERIANHEPRNSHQNGRGSAGGRLDDSL